MASYRSVSPIFSRTNQGGPFSPIIEGSSVRMASDSFLFTDGTNLSSAISLSMPLSAITLGLRVYLRVSFQEGVFTGAQIVNDGSWWESYPNTITYSDDSKKIGKQTSLYAPIFSVIRGQGVYGQYVGTNEGEMTVYRHVYNNLMLMQTCKYYFLLPAPFAPAI
jgi:hypothetical protein